MGRGHYVYLIIVKYLLYLYLGLLSYLPFCSSKFVNKEVENSNEMLIKSVRELKRFPHLGGGFTSQYAPVCWEFAKICNDVKSNPHLGPGWGGGGVGVSIDKCIISSIRTTMVFSYSKVLPNPWEKTASATIIVYQSLA